MRDSAVDGFDIARPSFRPARADEAESVAPLVFASGVREFQFFLGVPAEACIAFLRFAFAANNGRFSFRRHRVAVAQDGEVVAVLAVHDGRVTLLDDPHVAFMLLRFFGFWLTLGILRRGLILESELPAPRRSQKLLAHCATYESARGTGIFSALFKDALNAGMLGTEPGRELVLDVLTSNTRAFELYRRLNFTESTRIRKRSPKLPPELESIRMSFQRNT
ncbi:GNAT family N-acetyltransferase [Pararobbsia alpina]|nr:N-acetyltransferase [Pararobbsia alpina]